MSRKTLGDVVTIDGKMVGIVSVEFAQPGQKKLRCQECDLPEQEPDEDGNGGFFLYTQDWYEPDSGENIWCEDCIHKMEVSHK